nr:BrnT family toxin [uncultured Rhodopila sp.]
MDEFEWDENKRRINLEKHYLDFFDAGYVFRGPYLRLAAKTVKGEERWLAIGKLDDVYVAIVYTPRGSVTRLISKRKARKNEQQHYDKVFSG